MIESNQMQSNNSTDRFNSLVTLVVEELTLGKNVPEMSLPQGFKASTETTTSIFSSEDINRGSFQLLSDEGEKIFFFKSDISEVGNTKLLSSLGVNRLLEYSGEFDINGNGGHFTYGRLSDSAVNLSYYRLCDEPNEPGTFGITAILEQSANILSSIHNVGFVYNDYSVRSLIIEPGNQQPLILFHAGNITKDISKQGRESDIEKFLGSLEELNTDCQHITHRDTFLKRYTEKLIK